MEDLVGEQFVVSDGTMVHISEIKKARVILLYFSAIWCPPCLGFKATFHKFYVDANKDCGETKNVEVIMVPCEDEEEAAQEHLHEALWTAIPYNDPRIGKLQDKFEVDAIPVVMVVRKDGTIACETVKKMIQTKGASCLSNLIQLMESVPTPEKKVPEVKKEIPKVEEPSVTKYNNEEINMKVQEEQPAQNSSRATKEETERVINRIDSLNAKQLNNSNSVELKEKTVYENEEPNKVIIEEEEYKDEKEQIEDKPVNDGCCSVCIIL